MYPKYWMQPDCEKTFPHHLSIIKAHYCTSQIYGTTDLMQTIELLLKSDKLNDQASMFKRTMIANAEAMKPLFNINPFTFMWHTIEAC